MTVSTATATWKGTLKEGNGVMKAGTGAFEGPFTFASRFETGDGTNPEELIGGAHAGCYSMFLSALLSNNGFSPKEINTVADVTLGRDDVGPKIEKIVLNCVAQVPELDEEKFQEFAQMAKEKCPISRALASVGDIELTATLVAE